MKVAIVGAGSIGLLLGSFLAESDADVMMLVRREEQADLIVKHGIERRNADGTKNIYRVNATTDMSELRAYPLWIVAVKFSTLPPLLKQMQTYDLKNALLFIQNGIGHLKLALETKFPELAFATVEHGALKVESHVVRHNGIGPLTIGISRGEGDVFHELGKVQTKNFPIIYHPDVEFILMRKVLINCMINPLTALLEIENGELLSNPFCYELLQKTYIELMDVFPAMHSSLSFEAIEEVCRKTARNRSSMLTDRSEGRRMEIETIVSAVIEKAEMKERGLPLLTTFEKMLYAIDRKEGTT